MTSLTTEEATSFYRLIGLDSSNKQLQRVVSKVIVGWSEPLLTFFYVSNLNMANLK